MAALEMELHSSREQTFLYTKSHCGTKYFRAQVEEISIEMVVENIITYDINAIYHLFH
jgi:hypothetical protein